MLPNRILKAAMGEELADPWTAEVMPALIRLSERWAAGGTFESGSGCLSIRPGEPGTTNEAYFAGMAPRLRAMTEVPLALTGGLRSKHVMERLLEEGTVDLIGLGRPLNQQPDLSGHLLGGTADGIDLLPCPAHGVSELFWWIGQFRRLAAGEDLDPADTLRRSQLDATRSMAQQVVANLRGSEHDPVGR